MTRRTGRNSTVRVIASNLHVGGGVQAAASLIDEMVALGAQSDHSDVLAATTFEVSPEVWSNLRPGTRRDEKLQVRRRRPASVGYWPSDVVRRDDVELIVFGPAYFPSRARAKLLGYADCTSVYPDVPGMDSPRGLPKYRTWLRRRWSLAAAGRSDSLVVETEAMRDRLHDLLGLSPDRVRVIPNVVNSEILSQHEVPVPDIPRRQGERLLLYTTRAYPHKNLDFLPALRRAAQDRFGVFLRFVVTLSPEEWTSRSAEFRDACVNLGVLSVQQIAGAHRAVDAAIFPSLLEASSATPIEALALGTPLCASDRDFVRSTCRDAAFYFDPLDPDSAAERIVSALDDSAALEARRRAGLEVVRGLPTAQQRAAAYVALIEEHLARANTRPAIGRSGFESRIRERARPAGAVRK